ncbi:MAG: GNAT family N-acetyltransferase [Planctomycetales bacterium]|jgi:N-acetylglutamate synthase-like GNAT family acetyltransferase|nr:GNAT family N-acetyltransferase [Planctomycetales bacterium]
MTIESHDRFTIRPTREMDVEALGLFIAPFVEQGWLLPRTQDELEGLTVDGFVAESDGRIVGFAALEIYSQKLAELRSLAVATDHQGRGIGRSLVVACVELAKQRHIFEVIAITSSEEFFQRCGFDFTLPGEKKAVFLQTRETY